MLLTELISPVIDKLVSFIPNPVEREKARLEQTAALMAALTQADLGQIDVNKAEASSTSIFVAGWRPAVGWIGAFGLGWQFVLQPVLDWGLNIYHPGMSTPTLDSSQLMTLLFGLLGMGAMRSYDKMQGTSK